MSKPAAPQLVRVLVDFYQGGQLLYKKDNVYPLDDRLQLLTARGEAQDYTPPAPAKAAQAGGKRSKADAAALPATQTASDAAALPATQTASDAAALPATQTASDAADASNSGAGSADPEKDSDLNASETSNDQVQQAIEDVAKTDDQPAQA